MFKELDVVSLKHTVKALKLKRGSRGTIVQIYKEGKAFAVEFIDSHGYTVALLDLTPNDVQLVWSKNILPEISYFTPSTTISEREENYWPASLPYSKPNAQITNHFAY